MLNIGGSSADASYRYKMPALQTKIEGRGNGIKTIVVNMVDVAKSLHIHPAYTTKYFGIELGAQTKFEKKNDGRSIINGAHTSVDLQKSLVKMIDTFILCPTCKLPELKYEFTSKAIKCSCDACGYNGELRTAHKLASFMVKNPPQLIDLEDASDKTNGKKLSKDEKKAQREAKKKAQRGAGDDDDGAADAMGDLDVDEVREEEKQHRKQKKKSKTKEADLDELSDGEGVEKVKKKKSSKSKSKADVEVEDEWFTDTSKEAVKARKNAELAEMKSNNAVEHVEVADTGKATAGKQDDAITLFRQFVAVPRSTEQILAEVKRICMARAYDDAQKFQIVIAVVLDPNDTKSMQANFSKYAAVLTKLINDSNSSAATLLNVIEHYIGEQYASQLLSSTPHVIKALYDTEILTEQQIINWFDLPADNPLLAAQNTHDMVHQRAKVFVDWLKTADDDSDGSEEDSD